jgi:hypothetical protein
MPSRMIDYDALWTSERLAACKSSTRLEYLWLYGLADANGSFELNLRAIRSKVAAIRPRVTCRYLERVFAELTEHGLAFRWHENDKTYVHWTSSDVSGRLPRLSERRRYKRFAPDVPQKELREYESRCRRDNLATALRPGVGVGVGEGKVLEYRTPEACGLGVGVGVGAEVETTQKPEKQNLPFRKSETKTQPFDPACAKCGEQFPTQAETADHYQNCDGIRRKKHGGGM